MDFIECTAFLGGLKSIPRERLVFRPAVYGFILHHGHILLVTNRNTGKYSLPGGGVEIGERLETALKREIREETGLEIEVKAFLNFAEDFFYYDPLDEAFHSFLFFYHCRPKTFELLRNDQIDDAEVMNPRWVAVETVRAEDFQHFGEMLVKNLRRLVST